MIVIYSLFKGFLNIMKELKEDRVYIRLSREQKEKLKAESKKMNIPLSKYIRKMLKIEEKK